MLRLPKRLLPLALLLAACPPESENPISPADSAVLDAALIGSWSGANGPGQKLSIDIALKKGGVMTLAMPRDGDEPLSMEAHASTVGPYKLLNVRVYEKGEPTGWTFVRYAIAKDGSLETWVLESAPVRKAMEAGTLKARAAGGGTGALVITDTPAKIAAFIKAQKTDASWEKFGTFKRRGRD